MTLSELPWIKYARAQIGVREIKGPKHNSIIVQMWKMIKRGGIKDDETPWCAAFVGACLEAVGVTSSRFESASSYLEWGVKCPFIYGAIAVIKRTGGSGYHVGFVVGVSARGNVLILGGNQGDTVSIAEFARERLVATRWPYGLPITLQPPPIGGAVGLSTKED